MAAKRNSEGARLLLLLLSIILFNDSFVLGHAIDSFPKVYRELFLLPLLLEDSVLFSCGSGSSAALRHSQVHQLKVPGELSQLTIQLMVSFRLLIV